MLKANFSKWITVKLVLFLFTLFCVTTNSLNAQTQSTSANLTGIVKDQQGAVVPGAVVTARNKATNVTRTATSNSEGIYTLINLPTGDYEVTATATNFKRAVVTNVTLTVGQSADLDIPLEIGEQSVSVDVTSETEVIETTRTAVANTIEQETINNLPINQRDATGFALVLSTVSRDNGKGVGPAPTSGLNIGGQRGRSTLVQVDGGDFTDNSTNASRSTVSQEAVQEYQIATNSYLPEFGRAIGGIVNVVTKGGTNDYHGNLFGFFRHKSFQSRNPFSPLIDNDPGKKAPYTRAQYGLTFGGPLDRDRTFFFFSFEQRRRQESGFFTGDIVGGATSSITIGAPFLPAPQTFTGLTPQQVTYIQTILPANPAAGLAYAHLASTGTQIAQNGTSTLVNFLPGLGVPQGQIIGSRFILSGRPVPTAANNGAFPGFRTVNQFGQPIGFRPLTQLSRIFPISEATTFNSLRIDHLITERNQLSLRIGYNPSEISGIQDESQNQTLGQNDFSRTGIQKTKDASFASSLVSVLPNNMVNELYFNFGVRKATFDSQIPSIALQIAGTGFIGSNPFSPVDRRETRYQFRDSLSWVKGNHTFKFGADFNFIDIDAKFELNFPGLFNFSQQAAGSLVTGCDAASVPLANRCPAFTAIQAYGLGFPSVFIQGFGNPQSAIRNRPIAFFAQDTWKIRNNFTINYGVRYDVELTDAIAPISFRDPLTGITLSAQDVQAGQDALNVQQGFPRDKNNFAPRLGVSWDVTGDNKTVVRAAFGLFYDHPLLAVAFNSDIADGSQQQQSTLLPVGGPSPTALFNAFQVFHGTVVPGVTPGVAASAQYLPGQLRFNPNTFTGFGPVLPFTLHVGKDFEYAYATQGNFSVERLIGKNMSVSASYIAVNARHLPHPQDVNIVQTNLLVDNFRRFFGFAPTSLAQAAFGISIPTTGGACPAGVVSPFGCFNNAVGQTFAIILPNTVASPVIGGAINNNLKVVSPVAANYFRRLGPNYFFVAAVTGGASKATFDGAIVGSLRTPGPINAYADVNAQLSDGNSSYNALNLEWKKRFSSNIQFLATYTWAHSIDDSSDLQTLLKPQDNTNFRAERADSLFDQRHRFVFSGFLSAPDTWKSAGGFKGFLNGFIVSPIIELSSGRPFNILAVGDANGDFQSTNERPSVRSDGTLCAAGVDANCPQGFPLNGTLGRNRGITHNYFSIDMRLTRKIRLSERVSLDLIGEGFNLFNRFNEAAANPDYRVVNAFGQRTSSGKYYSQPTASFDPRIFQFALKLSF